MSGCWIRTAERWNRLCGTGSVGNQVWGQALPFAEL